METDIKSYNKINRIIWFSILIVMILLTVVVFILNRLQVFEQIPEMLTVGEILFMGAVALAIAILILKRSVFRLDKITATALKRNNQEESEIFALQQIRRNYIILWMLSETIGIVGFIFYIFTVNFVNYLLFIVVSLYSLAINFPREEIIRICLENLRQPGRIT